MKISQKLLDKLQGWEYEEYKNLSTKDFSGKKFEVASFILLQAFLCFVVACIYIFLNLEDTNSWLTIFQWTFLFGFINPYAWIPTCVIVFGLGLDNLYTKVYQHFSHKTKDYLRLQELETKFVDIEKQIEEDAILILCKIEIEARKRIRENRNINYDLRLKRKWQPWYEKDLETVKNNCEFNSEAYKLIEENIKYLKFDRGKFRRFKKLRDDLSNPLLHYSWLSAKINSLYGKPLSSNQSSTNRLTSKKTSLASPPQNVNRNNQFDKKQSSNPIDKNKPSIEKDSPNVLNPIELDFETPNVKLQNIDQIPKKRKKHHYEPIIKLSPELYLEMANKKIEIGLKGELLVMEYERKRLIEERENPSSRLKHESLENDRLGYDISSFENGKEIYIEVKTTTGSFWSNLYLTQNEYNKMEEYGEQYHLYRVWEFDTETNEGKLNIFKGSDIINKYFNFETNLYVLTERKN